MIALEDQTGGSLVDADDFVEAKLLVENLEPRGRVDTTYPLSLNRASRTRLADCAVRSNRVDTIIQTLRERRDDPVRWFDFDRTAGRRAALETGCRIGEILTVQFKRLPA